MVLALAAGALVSPAAAHQPLDCADVGNVVDFTVHGDLEITEHGTKCLITGTVAGNVTVRDSSAVCEPPPAGMGQQFADLTAANVVGGSILGNLRAHGGRCAMAWLREGADVGGNVIYRAGGNLGFLDAPGVAQHEGSTVHGNVILKGGLLWATSSSTTNRVDGHIICNGGLPRGESGLGETGSGSRTDWDGYEGDVDGTIGGRYIGC